MDLNKPPTFGSTPRRQVRARRLADEHKRDNRAKGAIIAAGCVVALAALPLNAFILMLVMGALHGAYPAVVAIGYGTSVLYVLGVGLLTGFVRRLFRK